MKIEGSVAFLTGANRGVGLAFVSELLQRGVEKIYFAMRNPASFPLSMDLGDKRVVPVVLDVTDMNQIAAAAQTAHDATLLINNAGYAAFQGGMSANDLLSARQEMEVNYFGPLAITRAFAPTLANSNGCVVNMLSMAALVSIPMFASYCASKAALLSMTRSIRAELSAQNTSVIGVMAVQIDTDLGARLPSPRMSPYEVVQDVLEAVEAGVNDEIYAGEQTRAALNEFSADPKAFQARMLTRLPQRAVTRAAAK